MLKIALTIAAIAAALVAVKQADVMQRAGFLSSCSPVASPARGEGSWLACRGGRLDGRPDLSLKSCQSRGFNGSVEYWNRPTDISTGFKP